MTLKPTNHRLARGFTSRRQNGRLQLLAGREIKDESVTARNLRCQKASDHHKPNKWPYVLVASPEEQVIGRSF